MGVQEGRRFIHGRRIRDTRLVSIRITRGETPRVLSSCDTPPTHGDARPSPIEESRGKADARRGMCLASPAPINAST